MSNLTDKDKEEIQKVKKSIFRQYRQERKLSGNAVGNFSVNFKSGRNEIAYTFWGQEVSSPNNYPAKYIIQFSMSEKIDNHIIDHNYRKEVDQLTFELNYKNILSNFYIQFVNEFIDKIKEFKTVIDPILLYNNNGLQLILHYKRKISDYQKLGVKWHNCLGRYANKYKEEFIIEILHNDYKMGITSIIPWIDLDSSFYFCKTFLQRIMGPSNQPLQCSPWMKKPGNDELFNTKLMQALPVVYPELKKLYKPNLTQFSDNIMQARQHFIQAQMAGTLQEIYQDRNDRLQDIFDILRRR